MDENSLMLPLEKMLANSALLSRCLGKLHTQPKSFTKIELREGLNRLGNVSGNLTILVENRHTGEVFSLKLNKSENQCPTQVSKLVVIIGIVLTVFVVVTCSCLGFTCSCLGYVLKINMKNSRVAHENSLYKGVEDGDIEMEDCEKKFIY